MIKDSWKKDFCSFKIEWNEFRWIELTSREYSDRQYTQLIYEIQPKYHFDQMHGRYPWFDHLWIDPNWEKIKSKSFTFSHHTKAQTHVLAVSLCLVKSKRSCKSVHSSVNRSIVLKSVASILFIQFRHRFRFRCDRDAQFGSWCIHMTNGKAIEMPHAVVAGILIILFLKMKYFALGKEVYRLGLA